MLAVWCYPPASTVLSGVTPWVGLSVRLSAKWSNVLQRKPKCCARSLSRKFANFGARWLAAPRTADLLVGALKLQVVVNASMEHRTTKRQNV